MARERNHGRPLDNRRTGVSAGSPRASVVEAVTATTRALPEHALRFDETDDASREPVGLGASDRGSMVVSVSVRGSSSFGLWRSAHDELSSRGVERGLRAEASPASHTPPPPRRATMTGIVATPAGLAEIAGLGPNVGLALHGAGGKSTIALPPATYAAAATDGARVYALGIDRSLYRSTLVTVSLVGGAPEVVATEVFTGGGAGIAVAAGRAYVANADGEIRVYDVDGARPSLAMIHSLEETP